jgi:hypothetical protein
MFGRPEDYKVELAPKTKPAKRDVHVTGYIVVEFIVDEWVEADEDMSDQDIKHEAMQQADIPGGDIERVNLVLDDEQRKERRVQRKREQELLAAWNAGEPIRA